MDKAIKIASGAAVRFQTSGRHGLTKPQTGILVQPIHDGQTDRAHVVLDGTHLATGKVFRPFVKHVEAI